MSSFLDKEGLQYFYNKLKDKFDTAIAQKADKSIATTMADGLMSSSDKAKLNEIVENGSLKVLRLDVSSMTNITGDTTDNGGFFYPTDEATLKEIQDTVDTIILTQTDSETAEVLTMATLQKNYGLYFVGVLGSIEQLAWGTLIEDDEMGTGLFITFPYTFKDINENITEINKKIASASAQTLTLTYDQFQEVTGDTPFNGVKQAYFYPLNSSVAKQYNDTLETIVIKNLSIIDGKTLKTMLTMHRAYTEYFWGTIDTTLTVFQGFFATDSSAEYKTGFYFVQNDVLESDNTITALSAQTKQNTANISTLSAKTVSINNQVTVNTSNISALQSKLDSTDFLKKDSTKSTSVLMGDGTYNTFKTIDGQSILGNGDIATDANCYYLNYSTVFRNKTAVTQDVYDIVKDVYNSNGKKHLYIYDPSTTVATGSEASIGIFFGKAIFYIVWINVNGVWSSDYNTFYCYSINNSLKLTDSSISLQSKFSGATTSNAGTSGWVPAPTTADTESYLCGNGKWQKVSGGSAKAVDMYPLLDGVGSSEWDKLSTSEKKTKYDAIKKAIAENQLFYFDLGTIKLPCTCIIVGSGTTDEYLLIVEQYTLGYANGYSGKFSNTYVQPNDMFVQIRASDYKVANGYITSHLFSGYNIKKINGQDITCSTEDGSGNLELKLVYKLDPNNFKFSDVAKAVIDGCLIQFTNWLLYEGVCASQVLPLTSDSDIATASTDVKAIRINFSSRNDEKVFADSITLTGDSKWSWNYMSKGFMMKSDYVIDTEMSDTSTNPVTNKAIKAYIDKLIGK